MDLPKLPNDKIKAFEKLMASYKGNPDKLCYHAGELMTAAIAMEASACKKVYNSIS